MDNLKLSPEESRQSEEYLKSYPPEASVAQLGVAREEFKEKFLPLYSEGLVKILGLTIKKDEINKTTAFLCQLSAYTEESRVDLSFNAPSSTGKSYIPLEIAQLFPSEDVITVGYCSPTGFFHDHGIFDKEKAGYIVDLSRKILIFLDQARKAEGLNL